jgi:hypothetical protein
MTLANGCSKIKRPSRLSLLVAMGSESRGLLPFADTRLFVAHLLSSCPINTHISTTNSVHPQNISPPRTSRLVHSLYDPLINNSITPSHCPNRFHPSLCITSHTHTRSITSPPTLLLTIAQSLHQVLNIHNNCLAFLV